ncbi:MAG: hypothetical protein ACTXOO_05110 [Sodalis sp. (in: enterobacteria)]
MVIPPETNVDFVAVVESVLNVHRPLYRPDQSGSFQRLIFLLNNLLAVVREFLNSSVSQSGLNRYLYGHEFMRLRDMKEKAPTPKHKALKSYESGYVHFEMKYFNKTSRRYSFRRYRLNNSKSNTVANVRHFLDDLGRACLIAIY